MLRQVLKPMLGYGISDMLHLRDDIVRYRLAPSELNAVLHQLAASFDKKIADENINTFHTVIRHGKRFVICPMSKDAENENNENNLPFIWDLLKKYYQDPSFHSDSILLMPLRLCRGYLKLPPVIQLFKRKHAVLVEVDLNTKRIQVHDAQDSVRWYCYPDKIAEKISVLPESVHDQFRYIPAEDYHAYNRQRDDYSCGYFVHAYAGHILKTGASAGCGEITLNIGRDFKDKYQFMRANHVFFGQDDSDVSELTGDDFTDLLHDWLVIEKQDVGDALLQDWSDVTTRGAVFFQAEDASLLEFTRLSAVSSIFYTDQAQATSTASREEIESERQSTLLKNG
ncbi:hypothetical protein AQUSIP_13520 [Aquicella siphonis]|uniref:Uncharacterized protein n=1 Tax=Aquicella siphonis TaxID=254247 RepID=A0A5E4PGA0_9COXI|nr:hypothetical protein [Aquicella siphonis]VVC76050.1 hypothetical protein AQUSIP_13520 [Aquicella siphonis]